MHRRSPDRATLVTAASPPRSLRWRLPEAANVTQNRDLWEDLLKALREGTDLHGEVAVLNFKGPPQIRFSFEMHPSAKQQHSLLVLCNFAIFCSIFQDYVVICGMFAAFVRFRTPLTWIGVEVKEKYLRQGRSFFCHWGSFITPHPRRATYKLYI